MTVTMELKEYEEIKEKLAIYDRFKRLLSERLTSGCNEYDVRFYGGQETEALRELGDLKQRVENLDKPEYKRR